MLAGSSKRNRYSHDSLSLDFLNSVNKIKEKNRLNHKLISLTKYFESQILIDKFRKYHIPSLEMLTSINFSGPGNILLRGSIIFFSNADDNLFSIAPAADSCAIFQLSHHFFFCK